MNYLISYDLNSPGQNYEKVCNAITQASTGVWCRPLESVYVIQSNMTAETIYNRISRYLDRNDRLLIMALEGDSFWHLEKSVSDYLQNML